MSFQRQSERYLNHLNTLSKRFLEALPKSKVSFDDTGMLSVFLFRAGVVLGNRELQERATDLRDLILFRPVRDVSFQSVLKDPWINFYSMKIWSTFDGSFDFRQSYPYRAKLESTSPPILHELFTGMIGHATITASPTHITQALGKIKNDLFLIDGLMGLEAPTQFAGELPGDRYPRANLGTPHGMVGALLFSIRHRDEELSTTLCETLFSLHAKFGELPAFWPALPSEPIPPSAWCYGTSMLGLAFLEFHANFPDSSIATRVREQGIKLIQKMLDSDLSSLDYHFCHGKAGVAQIALRSFELCGDRSMLDFSLNLMDSLPANPELWLNKTSQMTATQSDFLSGHLGIGFVLLSLSDQKEIHWDHLFLLS